MKTLLAIVDDWERLERYEDVLSENFEVEPAAFGSIGIAQATESNPDIILVDLAFEDMDEFEAKTLIRERRSLDHSLLVILCNSDSSFGRDAMDAGLSSKPELVIHRPTSVEDVAAQIVEAASSLRI